MRHPSARRRRALFLLPLVAAVALPTSLASTSASAATPLAQVAPIVDRISLDDLPDPLDRGSYTAATIQETKLGLAALQEPNSSGAAPNAGSSQEAVKFQIR